MATGHTSVYSKAVSLGFVYRYGEGKLSADGKTWLSRFQKVDDPNARPILYLGYNPDKKMWVEEVFE